MKLKMDVDLDDIEARKMLGLNTYNSTYKETYKKMEYKELQYNSKEEVEVNEIKLTESE